VIGSTVKKERPAPSARSVTRRDMSGKELGRVDLAPEVFGIVPNEAVLHQVVTAQLAAARAGTQSTKTRAEVRGGGRKPYRQKGTGRARQGSSRSPIWAGGGVAFGPKPRSYRQHTPKKMVRLALCSALSDRAASERVAVVDAWTFDVPRTKSAVAALDALGLDGKVLVVLADGELEAERSFGNLPHVQTVLGAELSAYDVLRNDWVVFSDGTLPGASGNGETHVPAVVDAEEPEKRPTARKRPVATTPADARPAEESGKRPGTARKRSGAKATADKPTAAGGDAEPEGESTP
jgi:large subunit ribosomal protein L4